MSFWGPYVPIAERKLKAHRHVAKMHKKGKAANPVTITGLTIARSFWGKRWCEHLESFSDYSNRLPRGKRYVRNGSVYHLDIQPLIIEANVSGTSLYNVEIKIDPLPDKTWNTIKKQCAGQVGSIIELLQGKISKEVMEIVSHRQNGLFPKPSEIHMSCSCPDWAVMCKHVAATLYGVGARLDAQPELLFLLRDVDPKELLDAQIELPDAAPSIITEDQIQEIFGIELEYQENTDVSIISTGDMQIEKISVSPEKTKEADTAKTTPKAKPVVSTKKKTEIKAKTTPESAVSTKNATAKTAKAVPESTVPPKNATAKTAKAVPESAVSTKKATAETAKAVPESAVSTKKATAETAKAVPESAVSTKKATAETAKAVPESAVSTKKATAETAKAVPEFNVSTETNPKSNQPVFKVIYLVTEPDGLFIDLPESATPSSASANTKSKATTAKKTSSANTKSKATTAKKTSSANTKSKATTAKKLNSPVSKPQVKRKPQNVSKISELSSNLKNDENWYITGAFIANLRQKLGMSVIHFAEQLGVAQSTIYRWETTQGKIEIQSRFFNAIKKLYRKSQRK
jgi:uncharacterized Zn finger protein/DNA-binding transcriptional regulator YiaG